MPLFVKIPKQLFKIRPSDARMYAVYLDLKAFNPEGIIKTPFKKKSNRSFYPYWLGKLVRNKWAHKEGQGTWSLVSYQEVWRFLGVNQSWNRGTKKYKFTYWKIDVDELPLERKQYIEKLKDLILDQVAGNKERQIKWRLKNKQTPFGVSKTETFLSCRSVAKLFGLKSSASGNKYRQRLFEVIDEPTVRINTTKGSRFQCKRIYFGLRKK